MRRYVVSTHLGDFETTASTPQRAVSNVRYRIFRRSPAGRRHAAGWTVRAANGQQKGTTP